MIELLFNACPFADGDKAVMIYKTLEKTSMDRYGWMDRSIDRGAACFRREIPPGRVYGATDKRFRGVFLFFSGGLL